METEVQAAAAAAQNSTMDDYEIVRKISTLGRNKFADVFEGIRLAGMQRCIIKTPNAMGRKRLKKEIEVLKALEGGRNVLRCVDVVWDLQNDSPSLIFEFFDNAEDFRSLYPKLESGDVRFYMRELLVALAFCHSQNIMHRDVRPPNVMINHAQKQLRLFGFSYAKLYTPNTTYNVRVGQGLIRAPELLLDHQEYTPQIDMWNAGAMLAALVFRREPFFHGVSSGDHVLCIARRLGAKDLLNFIERYDLETPDGFEGAAGVALERGGWGDLVTPQNERWARGQVLDLVDKLLRWDPKDRWTSRRALEHPYFEEE